MHKIFYFVTVILILSACNSEERKASGLQADFFQYCPKPEFYTVVFADNGEGDTLKLPLPMPLYGPKKLQQLAHNFRPKLAHIDTSRLDDFEKQEWLDFVRLLDSLEANPYSINRPGKFALTQLLGHFIGRDKAARHPGLLTELIEALPAYYEAVEKRWQPADSSETAMAIRQAQKTLELLDNLERQLDRYSIGYEERMAKALPAARYGVKDFIALCQSSQLQ